MLALYEKISGNMAHDDEMFDGHNISVLVHACTQVTVLHESQSVTLDSCHAFLKGDAAIC